MSSTPICQGWAAREITCCSIYVLFRHGSERGLTLAVNIEERTFSGAGQQTSFHFFGDVAERAIRLYDYQDMRWHLYTL